MVKDSLRSSEWLLIATLLAFLVSFVLIAKINAYRTSFAIAAIPTFQEEILVAIDGAVKKPGEYSFVPGITVEEILRKARPTSNAKLRALPLKERIWASTRITVETLQEIRVKVTGAIAEPVELVLPLKSRICDLKSKIISTQETEKKFFRRRKLLKDGDQIEVPKKTVE